LNVPDHGAWSLFSHAFIGPKPGTRKYLKRKRRSVVSRCRLCPVVKHGCSEANSTGLATWWLLFPAKWV